MDLKTILLELIRDYKSRKFLLVIAFGGFILYNYIENLGITVHEELLIASVVLAYIIMEGKADIEDRKGA